MSKKLEEVVEFKRNMLREMLSKCTESEVRVFNLMYKSVDEIDPEKMDWAIQ